MNNILQKFFQSKWLDWAGAFVFLASVFVFIVYSSALENYMHDHVILEYIFIVPFCIGVFGPYILFVLYVIGLFFGGRRKIRLFLLCLSFGYVVYISYEIYMFVLEFNKIQF